MPPDSKYAPPGKGVKTAGISCLLLYHTGSLWKRKKCVIRKKIGRPSKGKKIAIAAKNVERDIRTMLKHKYRNACLWKRAKNVRKSE